MKKHKGISIIIVPDRHARLHATSRSRTSAASTRTSRTTRTCASRSATSSARRTRAGSSSPTSSTTSASRCARRAWSSASSTTSREWAQETKLADGRRVDRPGVGADQPRPRARQARVPDARELARSRGSRQSGAPLNPADASTIKVFGTEFYMEAFRLLHGESSARPAPLQGDSPGAVLRGRVERTLRSMHILTFGGGTNEMQRDLIAIFGLNMPGIARGSESADRQEHIDGLRAHRRAAGAARASPGRSSATA